MLPRGPRSPAITLFVAALLVLTTACSASSSRDASAVSAQATSIATSAHLRSSPPIATQPQGPDDAQFQGILADFEAYAEQARRDWQVPGMAIGIVRGDQLVYARGFGVKEVGTSDPVDERTVFQIGSLSKAFTSAMMAMLVDDGKDAFVQFLVGPDGKITGTTVDVLNSGGAGTFRRVQASSGP